MNEENISIRRATEQDHPAIRGLVRGERLNPTDLKWPNFLVAAADGHITVGGRASAPTQEGYFTEQGVPRGGGRRHHRRRHIR
jgi:hypothetical protein